MDKYKFNIKERAMIIACDVVGSFNTSEKLELIEARKNWIKNIIEFAKNKKYYNIFLGFFSSDKVEGHILQELQEILQTEEIEEKLKEENINFKIISVHEKQDKCEEIKEELIEISKNYNVNDLLIFDDVQTEIGRAFILNDKLFEKNKDLRVTFIGLIDKCPFENKFLKKHKNNCCFIGLENDDGIGLGTEGYMTIGMQQLINKQKSKEESVRE